MDQSPLESYRQRRQQLEVDLQLASDNNDTTKLQQLSREYARLSDILDLGERVEKLEHERADAQLATNDASDPEYQQMAQAELIALDKELAPLRTELEDQLNPPDPNDSKDVLVEIRAGAGE